MGPGSAAHHFVLRSVRGTYKRKNKTAGDAPAVSK